MVLIVGIIYCTIDSLLLFLATVWSTQAPSGSDRRLQSLTGLGEGTQLAGRRYTVSWERGRERRKKERLKTKENRHSPGNGCRVTSSAGISTAPLISSPYSSALWDGERHCLNEWQAGVHHQREEGGGRADSLRRSLALSLAVSPWPPRMAQNLNIAMKSRSLKHMNFEWTSETAKERKTSEHFIHI